MKIVTLSDGTVQILPDDSPREHLESLNKIPLQLDNNIPNPANIPGLETAVAESELEPIESESPVPLDKFRILRNYGHLSAEDLFMTHYNRESPRAAEMSDEDLIHSLRELELIVQIGKIRQRAADDERMKRLENKQKSSREKQRLADSNFKVKNRTQIQNEELAKAAKVKTEKKKESHIEAYARLMGVTVNEAKIELASRLKK